MSNSNKGLGRGLDALFGGADPKNHDLQNSSLLPIDQLQPNPDQPRRRFDETSLAELASSIKSQGIIQPLLVRPIAMNRWQIVAGERRWRAARLAGLQEVPVFIKEMDDKEVLVAALVENLQREDLDPLEEALALQGLRDTLGLTQDELATRLGKSRPAISNALRLLQLSTTAQEDLREGRLSAGHARCLLALNDPSTSEELRQAILSQGLTVRQTEEAVSFWKEKGMLPWITHHVLEKNVLSNVNKARRKKSNEMRHIEQSLTQNLSCKATLNGDMENGRVILKYTSSEKLRHILRSLGLELE